MEEQSNYMHSGCRIHEDTQKPRRCMVLNSTNYGGSKLETKRGNNEIK